MRSASPAPRPGDPSRGVGSRRLAQASALALTVVGVFVVKGNAERWCPFGGVETAWSWFGEGNALCSVGVANLFLLGAVLFSLLLLRRAFCSHACPVGTISEWTRAVARRLGVRERVVPRAADVALSLAKYGVLAAVLAVTWTIGELWFRGACPAYALIGRHGADITLWAYAVSGAIFAGSVFVSLPFCRWLCPLAAVMNPLSRLGLARVRRDESACVACGQCSRACPMAIPVARVPTVSAARCTLCLDCVESCARRGSNALSLALPGASRRRIPAVAATLLFAGILGSGVLAAACFPLPSFRWNRGDLPAASASVDLSIEDLSCRGRANLLVWFLDRDDDLAVPGALRLEAWPAPGEGLARVTYDAAVTDADAIRAALTAPLHDTGAGVFRMSPFRIAGYDPLAPPAPPR